MKITHPASIIDEIIISESSPYRRGWLEIRLKHETKEEDANKFAADLLSLKEEFLYSSGIPPLIHYFDSTCARKIINYIFGKNLISAANRSDLETEIRATI